MSETTVLPGDALGYPFFTDPMLKAGQDPAGDIADGLSLRARKGPMLDYYGTADAPIECSATGSGDAILGDTLDVTDATWLHVEVAFFLPEDTQGTGMNCAVGLQASADGQYWFPYPVVNRATLISPATMFRLDDVATFPNPSGTGGYSSGADMTQNAPLWEDLTPLLPYAIDGFDVAPIQKAIPFNVASALYVRVVLLPIYTEPPDVGLPSLYVRVNKAVSP